VATFVLFIIPELFIWLHYNPLSGFLLSAPLAILLLIANQPNSRNLSQLNHAYFPVADMSFTDALRRSALLRRQMKKRATKISKYRLLSRVLKIAGSVILFSGLVDMIFALRDPKAGIQFHIQFILGGAIYLLGMRVAFVDYATLRKRNLNAPILLLRSFSDDDATILTSDVFWMMFLLGSARRKRLEQVISQKMAGLGPFVAVGKPAEQLPPLGAARVYLQADQWQREVLNLMHEAENIIMIAGTSRWVTWELEQIFDQGLTDKLLIFFPQPAFQDNTALREHMYKTLRSKYDIHLSAKTNESNALCIYSCPHTRSWVVIEATHVSDIDVHLALSVALGRPGAA